MLKQKKSRILLIEDNLFNARLIVDMLSERKKPGFTVKTAGTLAEGMGLLSKGGVDLILLDLNLPDSQGIETLSTLISHGKSIPVIVTSALEDETIALEALTMGASDYLLKGHIDVQILTRSIRYTLERKRKEDEMLKAKEQLEKAFEKRTQELRKLNTRLKDKVTELSEAQEKLKESMEGYKGLFDNSTDAVLTVDLTGTIKSANKTLSKMSGYSIEELVGKSYRELMGQEDAQRIYEAYNRLYRTGEPIRDFMSCMINKKHEVRVTQSYANVIRKGNEIVGFQATIRDITEKQKMEGALKESEQRLKLAIDAAQIGLWDWDIPSDRVTRSEGWFRMLGYSVGDIEPTRMAWAVLLHPDDLAFSGKAIDEHLAGKRPFYQCEFRMRSKFGDYRWILDRGQVVEWDNDGKPIRALGTHLDITERKRAEEAIRESESRFRRITTSMVDLIGEDDARGILTFVGPSIKNILGREPEEIIGRPAQELVHDEDKERVADIIRSSIKKKTSSVRFQYRFQHVDGHYLWLETECRLRYDANGRYVGAIYGTRDISERKLAEEALRESEKKFRDVFETSRDLIYICAIDGRVLDANEAAKRFLGYSSEEIKDLNIIDFYAHPEEREALVKEVIEKGYVEDHEIKVKKKDGTSFDALVTVIIKRDENGNAIGLHGSVSDITEKRRLEQQVIQSQKMEAVVSLAGGIAHNFNNILVGIMGYSEYLVSRKKEDDPDYKPLKTIHEGAVKASELTKQLLNTARTGFYNPSPINLNDVVEKVLPLVSGTFNRSIVIETHLNGDLMILEGDTGQLEQTLLNLCINARDAMPSGGKLIIETYNKKLDADFMKTHLLIDEGEYVVLSITDTGVGIAPETKERIFEPFFTTKDLGAGTGMGLATVYGIVKNHNGQISVYSEVGKGTTFKLYFPATDKKFIKIEKESKTVIDQGKGTILIIDDEHTVREMWESFLTENGYRVVSAENGQEGIGIFQDRKDEIDLIILDLIMPKMGGKETLPLLREIKPDIKVLISSGYSENGQAKEILESGVDGFIQKPIRLTELAKTISSILGKSGDKKKNE
jgi:two-component system, cell cycle sensor histidine kinase and response regulator CckA